MPKVWSDAERVAALTALTAAGGNVSQASRETGVPRQTITGWRDAGAEVTDSGHLKSAQDSAVVMWTRVRDKALGLAFETMSEETGAKSLATIAAIAQDKLANLDAGSGEMRVIVEYRDESDTIAARAASRLHPAQAEVLAGLTRYTVLVCGRRSGKSTLGLRVESEMALHGGRCWWVLPSGSMAADVWGGLKARFAGYWTDKSEIYRRIELPGGGSITVKSADRPDSLRGTGLDLVLLDEVRFMRDLRMLAEEVLRPALSDRKGSAIFASTPKGRANYLHELYQRGLSDTTGEWSSWRFPTASNPFIDPAEIEKARRELPAAVFEQEYLAEFVDSGTAVFVADDIDAMTEGWLGWQPPHAMGGSYLTAVDVGRRRDHTEVYTIDYSREPYQVVAHERITGVPYPVIQGVIEDRARDYPGRLVIESNGVGDPLIENLGVRAEPFVTTARSKGQAIQALQVLLERGALKVDESETLRQLRTYEWDDRALVQDAVMALAIAAMHLPTTGRVGYTEPSADFQRASVSLAGDLMRAEL